METRVGDKLKLNHTTGSIDIEAILNESDDNAALHLDTSLDSIGNHRRPRKKACSRLLSELRSDLGPKFSLSSDADQVGNLRSKYGRLQKVNEVSVTGYVPSDIVFREKKMSTSPVKAMTVITPPLTPEKTLSNGVEAMEVIEAEEDSVSFVVKTETPEEETIKDSELLLEPSSNVAEKESIVEPDPLNEEHQHEEKPVIANEVDSNTITDSPAQSMDVDLIPPEPAVSEKSEPTPDPPLPVEPTLPPVKVEKIPPNRRLSTRRMSIVHAAPVTSNLPPPPPIQSPVVTLLKNDASEMEEVQKGIWMNPLCLQEPRFLEVNHLLPGSMIWGSFAKYPPWPCLVVPDEKGYYIKQLAGKRLRFMIHVRFFGPKGLNSWIPPNNHIMFDPKDIPDDLRNGTRFSKKAVTEKEMIELNWAIEDAQIVANEENLEKRPDIFNGILTEQFNRWKEDKEKEAALKRPNVKRRRSSVASNASAPETATTTATNEKKRIKLSPTPPAMDNDTSRQSFSSSLSTTSSSGVSTMSKASSDVLSVSSAGLNETDDEGVEVKKPKKVRKSMVAVKEEPLEERLMKILKGIPVDMGEARKEKREELCRMCTMGSEEGNLVRKCSGSCGGLYHEKCLEAEGVSLDRINVELLAKQQKEEAAANKSRKRKSHRFSRGWNLKKSLGETEEVELEDDQDQEALIAGKVPHVTGESMLQELIMKDVPILPPIPIMPDLMKPKPEKKSKGSKGNPEDENFKCRSCRTGDLPTCFICHKKEDESEMTLCSVPNCGRAFHLGCVEKWPQAKQRKEGFVCPQHQCHLCISDDPRAQNFKQKSSQKLWKCIFCPTAYHLEQNCMPAGTEIVGHLSIICQRHFPLPEVEKKRRVLVKQEQEENNNVESQSPVVTKKTKSGPMTVNVNWCFICARGGSLVCCDRCPSAFHLECLKLSEDEWRKKTSDETFICEECELGRFPLYGELVWAKFGSYRWWPAVIVSEGQVPQNLNPTKRSRGEFCIRFLGSNDHAWIGRKRVFLYTDDDAQLPVEKGEKSQVVSPLKKGKKAAKKAEIKEELKSPLKELMSSSGAGKGMAGAFKQSLLEARVMNGMLQARKQERSQELSKLMRPCPYQKLKTNRPVAPVKLYEMRAESQEQEICQCEAIMEEGGEEGHLVACGPNSECLNRLLLTECNPANCPGGDRCANQRLQKRQYPPLDILKTEGKGWGLVAKKDLKEGELVVEYVGELINHEEMMKRIAVKEREKDDVYYFLTLTKDLIIDAERKGNMARFMNHSCEPNCESQKWTVNGNTRVGLFAMRDIRANTELTFNYNWESTGTSSTACQCGAKKCKGFIGGTS